MLDYVHSVPGRLRIQSAALRHNSMLMRQVRQHVLQIPGVETVTATQATGSIVIRYDPRELTSETLWAELTSLGLARPAMNQRARADASSLGEIVAKTISNTVMTKLAERSAAVLIGALI